MVKQIPRTKHHILFQGKHYESGYAHKLRSEKYLIVRIPDTLHVAIHERIHDIPTPNDTDCQHAYKELKRRIKTGQLSRRDTLMQRLSFLIDIWEKTCPATVAILKWNREVAGEFYSQWTDDGTPRDPKDQE